MLRNCLALLMLLISGTVAAETVYVTDVLRLRLQTEPTDASAVVTTLGSGDRLEVIERAGFYAFVKTVDGQEGWAKTGFLVAEKPARAMLAEVQAELDALKASVAPEKKALEDLRARVQVLTREAGEREQQRTQDTARIAELEAENQDFRERLSIGGWRLPWRWAAGGMLAALLGGLVAGMWWFDYRSRKRHGGFRIY